MKLITLLLINFIYLSFPHITLGRVDPPNYDFSLDKFKTFMPGQKFDAIEKTYSKKELMINDGEFKIYKFYVEHIRYRFAILVQFKNQTVTDFHARLPSYFLHDIFHQSLINRIGKQDKYLKKEEQAVYVWNNKNGNQHTYMGSCTITCFPVFYAVKSNNNSGTGEFKAIMQRLTSSKK